MNQITKADEGYYRLVVEPLPATATACRAISDTVFMKILRVMQVPDIRVKICPLLDKKLRLTSFLDSVDNNIIQWSKVNPTSPNINSITGDIDVVSFIKQSVYTYRYSSSTKCGTTSAIAYVRPVTNFIFTKIDTIVIDKNQELSHGVNMNRIFGLVMNGKWSYDATVNPDNTVSSNVKTVSPSSLYSDALIFDAYKAWQDAGAAYDVNYKGMTNAKKFTFRYITGKCAHNQVKTIVIIIN
jgi:hypothetical protein